MTTLLASEGDWEIRKTPCGKVYFLNHATGADQWACPEELAAKGYTETGPPPCQTGGACISESGSCAPAEKAPDNSATTVVASSAEASDTAAGSGSGRVKINMVDDI